MNTDAAVDTTTLNDMIEVLNDGRTFYEEAAIEVKRADLKTLFVRMARIKQSIANDLRTAVVANGAMPAEGGSFAGKLRTVYAEVRAKLSSHKDDEYVTQLEEFEDRIMCAFKNAASASDDQAVRTIANRYMPEVMRDHNEMKALKEITAH
jgi:uncharacterized protein (TIGR02284 family)